MEKNKAAKWIAPCVTAAMLFALNAWVQHLFGQETAGETMSVLSNSFTVPGVVLCGIALLGWIGTFGQFDMLSYGSRKFFGHFIHSLSDELPDHFYEYREQRNEQGREWNKTPLWVGLACLACAAVSLVLYFVL